MDLPWLRCLLDERERFVGRAERSLEERLAEPLPVVAPEDKRRIASHVLGKLGRPACVSAVPPIRARERLFLAAAQDTRSPDDIVAEVATSLGVSPEELSESLFADVRGERKVTTLADLTPGDLALRCNLALAQALLQRSSRIELSLLGNARPIVRQLKFRRLICSVLGHDEIGLVRLEISGALSLFHHTLVYGRSLAEIVPLLAWCHDFKLEATCVLGGRPVHYELRGGDPVFPSTPPRRHDSQLEAAFARSFGKAAPNWDIIREPEPVATGAHLIFPDFILKHRLDPSRSWVVELVGFYTPEYLNRKLELYRAAGLSRLILCIDETLSCAPGDVPADAHVVRFRRRVDVDAILAIVGQ